MARRGERNSGSDQPRAQRERWYVYLARCGDGTLYTGIARDVARRLSQHAIGKGARYTRGRGPISLHASQMCLSRSRALRLELLVKSLPREHKESLADANRFRHVARSLRSKRNTGS